MLSPQEFCCYEVENRGEICGCCVAPADFTNLCKIHHAKVLVTDRVCKTSMYHPGILKIKQVGVISTNFNIFGTRCMKKRDNRYDNDYQTWRTDHLRTDKGDKLNDTGRNNILSDIKIIK
jgi:hypothetical protein